MPNFKRVYILIISMKNIIIYTECPDKNYYSSLYYFAEKNNIKIEMQDSRFLYLTLVYLNNNFRLIRILRKILTGKENIINLNIKIKDILKSFISPFKLFFKKNIVVAFAPYSSAVYYLLILKLLNRNLIYETSWSYWDNPEKYVHKPVISRFFWKLYLKNTKVVTPTKFSKESLLKLKATPFYMPHSIDISLYKKLRNKKLRVLYVGRLIEEKGIRGILDISKYFPNIEFVFAGKGKLESLFKNNQKNVRYLGYISDKNKLAEIYSSCNIFILNSYSTKNWEEWFGIVLLEAMASGLAVISTDCIGPKEIIISNYNGILIEQKNKLQLKSALSKLAKNPILMKKLGNNAVKSAKEYEISKVAEKWKEIF